MADLRGWSVVVMVMVYMQMAECCFFSRPRPKPCPGKTSETQLTMERKACIFPFLDTDGTTELTNCTTLEGYSNEDTYCATSLNADCTYKELGVCLKGGGESCSLTKAGETRCNKGCVIWANKDMDANSYKVIRGTSVEECVTQCKTQNECKFWVYNIKDQNCYLIKTNNDATTTSPGYVSGNNACDAQEGCVMRRNTDLQGTKSDEVDKIDKINTIEECISKCGENKKCMFWVYKDIVPKECTLYSSFENEDNYKPGYFSGNKGCAMKTKTSDCKLFSPASTWDKRQKKLIIKHTNSDKNDCSKKCGTTSLCVYWIYNTETMECLLIQKGTRPPLKIDLDDSKHIIGGKACGFTEKEMKDCKLFSPVSTWNKNKKELITESTTDDKDDCSKKCGIEPSCDYWIYRTDKSECQLIKKGTGTLNIILDNNQHIIGGKTCALTLQHTIENVRQCHSPQRYYHLPDEDWEKRCQIDERGEKYKEENTLPKYTNNREKIPLKLVKASQKILELISDKDCEKLISQTVALALARVTDKQKQTMKTILYLAGNLEKAFNLDENKNKIMNAIKQELDGLFHEVQVINSDTPSYEYGNDKTGLSHYHAEMQIGKYIISRRALEDIVIDYIGVTKPPCCACNSVLRESYLEGTLVTTPLKDEEDLLKLEDYYRIYKNTIIVSGSGKKPCETKDGIEFNCGSQFQSKDIAMDWYWKHPVWVWKNFNNGILDTTTIYEEIEPSFKNSKSTDVNNNM